MLNQTYANMVYPEGAEFISATCKRLVFTDDSILLYNSFDDKIGVLCNNTDLSRYFNNLMDIKDDLIVHTSSAVKANTIKILTKFTNIADINLELEPSNESILYVNRIIKNNAENLRRLAIKCKGNISCDLDLTPLANAHNLRTLYIDSDANTIGINSLPHSVTYLNLSTKHTEPFDLSCIPSNAWNFEMKGDLICSDNTVVYPNLTTLGLLETNLDNSLVCDISKMCINVSALSFGDSYNVTDISPLISLKDLYVMFVNNTSVSDANQFKGFDKLFYLDISNTLIDSVRPLYDLPTLHLMSANSSKKLFSDEAVNLDEIKNDNLPVILNSNEKNKRVISPQIGNYEDMYKYVCDILNNSKFCYDKPSEQFIPQYKFKLCNKIVPNRSYSVNSTLFDGKSTLPNAISCSMPMIWYTNLKELTTPDMKSVFTLPSEARLEYLKTGIDTKDLIIANRKADVLSELETVYLTRNNLRNCDISISDIDVFINDNLKNIKITGLDIVPGGCFNNLHNVKHICINANNRTELTFNLNDMPNLVSIELYNVVPHFIVTKKHKSLRYIGIHKANILNLDDMFICDSSVTQPLIEPTLLNVEDNCLESMKSDVIGFSKIKAINVSKNLLTDDEIILPESLQSMVANDNFLSESKKEDISNFNRIHYR